VRAPSTIGRVTEHSDERLLDERLPGLAIFPAALALNFFGDGVRDMRDVRLSDSMFGPGV
jgi:hypothetical protein